MAGFEFGCALRKLFIFGAPFRQLEMNGKMSNPPTTTTSKTREILTDVEVVGAVIGTAGLASAPYPFNIIMPAVAYAASLVSAVAKALLAAQ